MLYESNLMVHLLHKSGDIFKQTNSYRLEVRLGTRGRDPVACFRWCRGIWQMSELRRITVCLEQPPVRD